MSGGGGSNKKQVKKQFEYDTKKHQYEWDQMNIDHANQVDMHDLQVKNAEAVRTVKNKQAQDQWDYKDKMQTFDYANQMAAYNASQKAYDKQLDYNSLAQEISVSDNNRKWNERLKDIGFKNENLLMDLQFKKETAGIKKVSTAQDLRNATKDAQFSARSLLFDLESAEKKVAGKRRDLDLNALQKAGSARATGQTGRTARRNLQAVLFQQGQGQTQLLDMLTSDKEAYGLKMEQVASKLASTKDKGQLNYTQIANEIVQTTKATGYKQKQLQHSQYSAYQQLQADQAAVGLKKLGADLAAENKKMGKPIQKPSLPPPFEIPKPETKAPPGPPSQERWDSVAPIKGAVSKPSMFQKIAGVVGMAASAVSLFSDDRLKYDITRVGTSKKGIPKYTFKYRFDGKHGPTYIGTSAQDLIEMGREDAVGTTEKDGFYYVDYSKLDVEFEKLT
jgi:hypothetical protein|tara:strand:+ start:785 stop:2128 length:1344 start_codon:yes stop_codon:yes gene_type:complete